MSSMVETGKLQRMEDTLELGLHDLAFMLPLPLPKGAVPDMPPDDFQVLSQISTSGKPSSQLHLKGNLREVHLCRKLLDRYRSTVASANIAP